MCLNFRVKNKPFGFSSQLDALFQNQGFLDFFLMIHNLHAQFKNIFKIPTVFLRYSILIYSYYNISMLKYSKVSLFVNIFPSLTLLWNHQVALVHFLIGTLLYSDNVCNYLMKSYCIEVSPKIEFRFIHSSLGSTYIELKIDDIICLFSQLLPYFLHG